MVFKEPSGKCDKNCYFEDMHKSIFCLCPRGWSPWTLRAYQVRDAGSAVVLMVVLLERTVVSGSGSDGSGDYGHDVGDVGKENGDDDGVGWGGGDGYGDVDDYGDDGSGGSGGGVGLCGEDDGDDDDVGGVRDGVGGDGYGVNGSDDVMVR